MFRVGPGHDGPSGECYLEVTPCEWHGVCDPVVLSAVEVCADHGACVNVCGAVCPLRLGVVCCAVMQRSGQVGCHDLCPICDARSWRCSSMDRVCVSSCRRCVSVVHPAAIPSTVCCVMCSLFTFVYDASGDHMVETHSSMGLAMALHVAMIVTPCC